MNEMRDLNYYQNINFREESRAYIFCWVMDSIVYRHIDHSDNNRLYGNISAVKPEKLKKIFKINTKEAKFCIKRAKDYLSRKGYNNFN